MIVQEPKEAIEHREDSKTASPHDSDAVAFQK